MYTLSTSARSFDRCTICRVLYLLDQVALDDWEDEFVIVYAGDRVIASGQGVDVHEQLMPMYHDDVARRAQEES